MSADGGTVWFSTTEPLVPEDTNSAMSGEDIYVNDGGEVSLLTPGVSTWALWLGRSADDARTFFVSTDKLTDEDLDAAFDIYMAEGGELHLVSKRAEGDAPDTGAEQIPAFFDVAFSADGSHVFFETPEAMTAADQDTANDVYERFDGHTSLVTTGTAESVDLIAASADGARVLFETREPLGAADAGTDVDYYLQSGGVRTHVTTGPGDDGNDDPFLIDFSPDLSRFLFETAEPLLPDEDTDVTNDLYLSDGRRVVAGLPRRGGRRGLRGRPGRVRGLPQRPVRLRRRVHGRRRRQRVRRLPRHARRRTAEHRAARDLRHAGRRPAAHLRPGHVDRCAVLRVPVEPRRRRHPRRGGGEPHRRPARTPAMRSRARSPRPTRAGARPRRARP